MSFDNFKNEDNRVALSMDLKNENKGLLHTEMNFKIGKKKYKFNVLHNLHEYGLPIDAALINWSARTDDFTIESFCDYVVSKDRINFKCKPR